MKILKLELTNFACYYGDHIIDLDTDDKKNVIIFIGSNGAGKTTIFNAINWALYGEEYEKDLMKLKKRAITDYVNETALEDAYKENATADLLTTLYFEHDSKKYYITQYLEIKPVKEHNKSLRAEIKFRKTEMFNIMSDGDHVPIKYYNLLMDEILPNNVCAAPPFQDQF